MRSALLDRCVAKLGGQADTGWLAGQMMALETQSNELASTVEGLRAQKAAAEDRVREAEQRVSSLMRRIEEESEAIRHGTQAEISKHTERVAMLQVGVARVPHFLFSHRPLKSACRTPPPPPPSPRTHTYTHTRRAATHSRSVVCRVCSLS